jgi:DNA-binding response OmpR family regulator
MEKSVVIFSNCPLQSQAVQHIYQSAGYQSVKLSDAPPRITLEQSRPDVVVIAPRNEGGSMAAVCQQVRAISPVPMIASPQFHDDIDEMNLLAAGADDYVARDRNHRILIMRTEALMNRATQRDRSRTSLLAVGRLVLDLDSRIVHFGNTHLLLTRTEFDLLTILIQNSHRVVHREELLNRVWGSWYGDDHILEVHISRLRRKIESIDGTRIFHPVRGVGYRLLSYGQTLD